MNEIYCRQCKKVIQATDEYCGGCGSSQNQKSVSSSPEPHQTTVQMTPDPASIPENMVSQPVKRQSPNSIVFIVMGVLVVLMVLNNLSMMSRVDHLEKQVRVLSTGVDKLGQNVDSLGNTVDYNAGVSNRNNDALRRAY